MQRDGRGFDHRTLVAIRLIAVERVRDGERPSSVIASFGFNRTTIYRWLEAASKPGVGLSALHSRPATGRPESDVAPGTTGVPLDLAQLASRLADWNSCHDAVEPAI